MKISIKRTAAIVLVLVLASGIQTTAVLAQTLVAGSGPIVDEELAGVRLRNFNGVPQGAFLGIPDLGLGENRVETNIQWAASNSLTWRLDPDLDQLFLNVANSNGQWTLTYDDWSNQLVNLTSGDYFRGDLNVMALEIWNRDDNVDALVSLSNIQLDGQPMGDFSAAQGLLPPREQRWITDYCFGTDDGFELTATLELEDITAIQAELNRVNLSVGVAEDSGLNCANPANMNVSIEPATVTLLRGEEQLVSVTLSNQGEGPARSTRIQLQESETLTLTDALGACGDPAEPGIITCPVGDIGPEEEFQFEFTIRANDDAPYGLYQYEVGFRTISQNLDPNQSASVTVRITDDLDRVFSDRFESADVK